MCVCVCVCVCVCNYYVIPDQQHNEVTNDSMQHVSAGHNGLKLNLSGTNACVRQTCRGRYQPMINSESVKIFDR